VYYTIDFFEILVKRIFCRKLFWDLWHASKNAVKGENARLFEPPLTAFLLCAFGRQAPQWRRPFLGGVHET
jgi:hypothetical protein